MQKPQDSCAGGPLLDSVGILPRLFDSHCFFIQQTADTTMLQRLSSCFRVRLGPSVREQQPYCTAPVAMWGWKKGGGRQSWKTVGPLSGSWDPVEKLTSPAQCCWFTAL